MRIQVLIAISALSLASCTGGDPAKRGHTGTTGHAGTPILTGPSSLKDFGRSTEPVDFDHYESIYHVSKNGSDTDGDGSRERPFATIQEALEKVARATESAPRALLVAAGAYGGATGNPDGGSGNSGGEAGTFGGEPLIMQEHIEIYGGFDPLTWERDIDSYKTILTGGQQSRVLIGADHSRIDGFYIMNGRIRGNGGAVYCEGTSPVISNNYFFRNMTLDPVPWNPKFIHEKAHDGGAVYACDGASPVLRNNVFTGNETQNGRGGAVAFHNRCKGVIHNNVFLNNTAGLNDSHRSSDGGAVSVFDWCSVEIIDNLFIGNRALTRNDGGALFVALWSSALIRGNYFFNNESMDDAGALFTGGQEHRYDSPLDPLPPADEFFVTIDANVFMGNRNPTLNSGAMRLTMETRGDFTNNLAAFNNGLYFQRSDLGIYNNTIIDNILLTETKEGLNPSRLKNTIVLGNTGIKIPVEQSYCLLLDGKDEAGSRELRFEDDGIAFTTLGILIGPDRTKTRLIVQGNFMENRLKNRIIRAGNRFTLVKENQGNEILIWDDLTSESEFMIMPTYTPAANSPAKDSGTEVPLGRDLYGNPRPAGKAVDIGAVEIQ
jgi:hypothetical protein